MSRDQVTIEVKETIVGGVQNSAFELNVYPQPVSNVLYINNQQGAIEKIQLFDVHG